MIGKAIVFIVMYKIQDSIHNIYFVKLKLQDIFNADSERKMSLRGASPAVSET
jgi:hypothetical protein